MNSISVSVRRQLCLTSVLRTKIEKDPRSFFSPFRPPKRKVDHCFSASFINVLSFFITHELTTKKQKGQQISNRKETFRSFPKTMSSSSMLFSATAAIKSASRRSATSSHKSLLSSSQFSSSSRILDATSTLPVSHQQQQLRFLHCHSPNPIFTTSISNYNNINNPHHTTPPHFQFHDRHFATSSTTNKNDENNNKQSDDKKEEDFSETTTEKATTNEEKSESGTDSLRDAVNRMKQQKDGEAEESSSSSKTNDPNDMLRKMADVWDNFTTEVSHAWQELLKSGERKDINKKIIKPEATAEGEAEYTGPVDIMVIDPSEHLTAWERMQRRLTEAPIIQRVLEHSDEFLEKSGAKKVKKQFDHLSEDAKEAWETSQNPWVYRASSVYDTLTAESPETAAVRELRQLDPEFTLEDWRQDVVELTLPQIMEWFLQGKVNQLKPWLGEGVFKRIASEVAARKQEGVQIDTHVLGIMNSEIIAIEVS